MPGQLFTQYFFNEGIRETPEWTAAEAAFAPFRERLLSTWESFKTHQNPNEAATEPDLLSPVLEVLGWMDYLPQQGTSGNEDIPDHLLFPDADSKDRAVAKGDSHDGYIDALGIEESERFGLPLESRELGDKAPPNTPHGQTLRYLATADIESEGLVRWGILTNGARWRLYDCRTRPRPTAHFEANPLELLDTGNEDGLRLFYFLFSHQSFTPQTGAATTFLETALAEGRRLRGAGGPGPLRHRVPDRLSIPGPGLVQC